MLLKKKKEKEKKNKKKAIKEDPFNTNPTKSSEGSVLNCVLRIRNE